MNIYEFHTPQMYYTSTRHVSQRCSLDKETLSRTSTFGTTLRGMKTPWIKLFLTLQDRG